MIDNTPLEVVIPGKYWGWKVTMTWGKVKAKVLKGLPSEHLPGVEHALDTEGAWYGTVDNVTVSLKLKEPK
jgi:hypothetical protein